LSLSGLSHFGQGSKRLWGEKSQKKATFEGERDWVEKKAWKEGFPPAEGCCGGVHGGLGGKENQRNGEKASLEKE